MDRCSRRTDSSALQAHEGAPSLLAPVGLSLLRLSPPHLRKEGTIVRMNEFTQKKSAPAQDSPPEYCDRPARGLHAGFADAERAADETA